MNTPSPDRFQHPTKLEMSREYRRNETTLMLENRLYEELSDMTLAQIMERLDEEGPNRSAISISVQLEQIQNRCAKFLAQNEMERLEAI